MLLIFNKFLQFSTCLQTAAPSSHSVESAQSGGCGGIRACEGGDILFSPPSASANEDDAKAGPAEGHSTTEGEGIVFTTFILLLFLIVLLEVVGNKSTFATLASSPAPCKYSGRFE